MDPIISHFAQVEKEDSLGSSPSTSFSLPQLLHWEINTNHLPEAYLRPDRWLVGRKLNSGLMLASFYYPGQMDRKNERGTY